MRVGWCAAETAFSHWLEAALMLGAAALSAQGGRTAAQVRFAKSTMSQTVPTAVREIDDPHLGTRWVLLRDPEHPEGPGRLAQVANEKNTYRIGAIDRMDVAIVPAAEVPPRLVIRGGDRLIVEENTATIEARLEAVALGAASPGGRLQARLKIGGKVVRAVARGPGRAALAAEIEVRP